MQVLFTANSSALSKQSLKDSSSFPACSSIVLCPANHRYARQVRLPPNHSFNRTRPLRRATDTLVGRAG
jgi:hypothetical protein